MTRNEVAVMLGMLRELYGKQGDSPNPGVTIDLWHRYLCDEPTELVQMAVDQHIASSVFHPKISEILERVEKRKTQMFYESGPNVVSLFNDELQGRELPPEYLPRSATNRKAYEMENEAKIMKRLKGLDKIGKLPEGG